MELAVFHTTWNVQAMSSHSIYSLVSIVDVSYKVYKQSVLNVNNSLQEFDSGWITQICDNIDTFINPKTDNHDVNCCEVVNKVNEEAS